ncbi:MAG: FG-GAP-like repeat-containing protein [Acidobacteriota bacterium]|nr:FG-GAP-like repeat-containing protein [Acidobacteriota bacterium]
MRTPTFYLPLVLLLLISCGQDRQAPPKAEAGAALSSELLDQIIVPFNRGVALMDQFKPREAAGSFEEVVALAPDWVLGRLNYGIALLNAQDDPAGAERELKWVIERAPENPYGHYALGMLLRHQGRLEEAEALYRRVLEIDPEDADAHYQLGSLLQERDVEAARKHLQKTLDKIPHHESACYSLGRLLRRAGDHEGSQALMARFQLLRRAKVGVVSGMKYGEMGRYAEVVRFFETPPPDNPLHGLPEYTEIGASLGLDESSTTKPGTPGLDTSFGPGLAAADIAGNGNLALYLTGMSNGGLLSAADGQRIADAGIDGADAIGAWFGDYDGDGDPDLYLTCRGPNRLYRNNGDGSFSDVTDVSGTAGGSEISVGATWADADHDGDLDLYVANYAAGDERGAPNHLWRNNGDGSFVNMATTAGIDGGKAATTAVIAFDFDSDRDLDLYLVNDGAPNRLFLNERVGNYRDATALFPHLADDGAGLGAVLSDLDGNGREDLLLIRGAQPPRLLLCNGPAAFAEDARFTARVKGLGGAHGALAADLDLDGDNDLVLLDAGKDKTYRHQVLMNTGTGAFEEPAPLGEPTELPRARGALALDLDGNGSLELVIARAGAPTQVWRAASLENRNWLTVLPADGEGPTRWLDPTAMGLLVEVKAGGSVQVAGLTSSTGYLGSAPRRVHFGLGRQSAADYVRLSWLDGVFQSELEVPSGQQWRIAKMVRKPSSCPILFTWDGERFAYVTDFLGVGGSGFFTAPGQYGKPDPSEHVRIPPELIQEKGGRYEIRIAEPLEEVTYLDYARLIAYDHPAKWTLYPDERFKGSEPMPTGEPRAHGTRVFPGVARTSAGTDVRAELLSVDRRYVSPPPDPRFKGFARDHWLELDFSGQLDRLERNARLVLYLHGWVSYTFSHINYAAWQAGIAMQGPRIEVPDGNGGWRVHVADMGFPAGFPRMMTFDLDELDLHTHPRFRIRTNMRISWDQIFAAPDLVDERLVKHTLSPSSADLRYLGFPREFSPDGREPTLYDYHRLDKGVPFRIMAGNYTRMGDVTPLLYAVDDRFVIFGRGEEIALSFDATALPSLKPGWTRTLVLHADGYCKDMDLYTAYPDTVEPLPYRAMDNYPPAEPAPNAAQQARDAALWHTRRLGPQDPALPEKRVNVVPTNGQR